MGESSLKTDRNEFILKELSEMRDLLGEILRRLGKLEYTGRIEYGDPYNVGRSNKQINIDLVRKDRWDRLESTKGNKK